MKIMIAVVAYTVGIVFGCLITSAEYNERLFLINTHVGDYVVMGKNE